MKLPWRQQLAFANDITYSHKHTSASNALLQLRPDRGKRDNLSGNVLAADGSGERSALPGTAEELGGAIHAYSDASAPVAIRKLCFSARRIVTYHWKHVLSLHLRQQR